MEKFNLERALAGEPVITREGKEVTQLTYFKEAREQYNLVGLMEGVVCTWNEKGTSILGHETSSDLFMKPKENAIWVNVYKNSFGKILLGSNWETEEEAIRFKDDDSLNEGYLKTIKITES
jgi:hypothetical protein